MSKGKIARLVGGALAAIAALWPGGIRPGPGEEDQDRRRLRPDRPVRRRRLGAAVHRRQDHDRLLHQAGRRRGLPDRGGLCRRPEQARRGDQRSDAPGRAGKGRHAARLLCLGRVRSGRRQGRAAQEVHVDHDLHLERGAGEPAPALCLPAAGRAASSTARRRPTSSPTTRRRSSARIPRTCAWPSSTRTAPMASTSPRATRSAPRSTASTSC